MIEAIFTWRYFIEILILFGVIYLISLLFGRRCLNALENQPSLYFLTKWVQKLTPFFLPFAIIYLLVVFIGIKPIFHGFLLTVLGIILFPQIRNFIDGIAFRSNPSTKRGSKIIYQQVEGELKQLLHLGVLVSTRDGEHFINYSNLQKNGFSIFAQNDGTIRQTINLEPGEYTSSTILDALFANPLIDISAPPKVRKELHSGGFKIHCTLEQGAELPDLVHYLEQNGFLILTENDPVHGNS